MDAGRFILAAVACLSIAGTCPAVIPYGLDKFYEKNIREGFQDIPSLPASLTRKEILEMPVVRKPLWHGVCLYKLSYSEKLFGEGNGRHRVCMVVIDWPKTKGQVSLKIAKDPELNRHRPSDLMMDNPNCIATFNGFYHQTEDPSRPYFPEKIDGKVYESIDRHHPMGSIVSDYDGIICFDPFQPPVIGSARYDSLDFLTNHLTCAGCDGIPRSANPTDSPRLVNRNLTAQQVERNQRFRQHSDVFAGHNRTNDVTVVFTVDRRPDDSYIGITYAEAEWFLMQFGIRPGWTVGLDAGGSTLCATKKLMADYVPYDDEHGGYHPYRVWDEAVIENEPRDDHVHISERKVLTALQIVVGDR